jgi:hypothetical protein
MGTRSDFPDKHQHWGKYELDYISTEDERLARKIPCDATQLSNIELLSLLRHTWDNLALHS